MPTPTSTPLHPIWGNEANPDIHLILDWETHDTSPSAVIWAYAAQLWIPSLEFENAVYGKLCDSAIVKQQNRGRTELASTVEWKAKQDWSSMYCWSENTVEGMLCSITELLQIGAAELQPSQTPYIQLWGFGATFDLSILESLLRMYPEVEVPLLREIPYQHYRCLRTLVDNYNVRSHVAWPGKHNPLLDCGAELRLLKLCRQASLGDEL